MIVCTLNEIKCETVKILQLLLKARSATDDEILNLHSKEHFEMIKNTSGLTIDELKEIPTDAYSAVYYHPVKFTFPQVLFIYCLC